MRGIRKDCSKISMYQACCSKFLLIMAVPLDEYSFSEVRPIYQ